MSLDDIIKNTAKAHILLLTSSSFRPACTSVVAVKSLIRKGTGCLPVFSSTSSLCIRIGVHGSSTQEIDQVSSAAIRWLAKHS